MDDQNTVNPTDTNVVPEEATPTEGVESSPETEATPEAPAEETEVAPTETPAEE